MILSDIQNAIRHIQQTPQPEAAEVLTGSIPNFAKTIDRLVGLSPDPRMKATSATFMGLPVILDERIPPNRCVLKQGGQVVAVMSLDE
jgi:hypothetical protein